MSSSFLSTPRGDLRLLLPAAIAASVPAVSHADEGEEALQEAQGDSFVDEPLPQVDAVVGYGVGFAASVGIAFAISMFAKGKALAYLRKRAHFANERVSSSVNDGLRKFRWLRANDFQMPEGQSRPWDDAAQQDITQGFDHMRGLSREGSDLSYDVADILDARDMGEDADPDGLLREVGMTDRLAIYWRKAGYGKNAESMHIRGLALFAHHGKMDAQSIYSLGEILVRGSIFPARRVFDRENTFRIAAQRHERIGRSRMRTRIFAYEVMLLKAFHMFAATALWLERADFAPERMDKLWSLYWARGALAEAVEKLDRVQGMRADLFKVDGSPLTRIKGHVKGLEDEIELRREVAEGPPKGGAMGGIIPGGPEGGPPVNPEDREPTWDSFARAVYSPAISQVAIAQMALGSPVLSMV